MYLATAGQCVILHKTEDYGTPLRYKPRLNEKKGIAYDLSWSSDGRYFGAVCDGWPKVEIFRVGDVINIYRNLQMVNPASIAFSKKEAGLVAVGNKEGVVATFNCKFKENPTMKFPSCHNEITALDFSSSDSAVAAGTSRGEVFICGIKSGKLLDKKELTWNQTIRSLKFHHSRKGIMAAGCDKGSVTIWDINVGTVEKQFLCHQAPCRGIVFSPNNITFMASIGFDAVVNFFDIRSKRIIYKSSIPEAGSSLDMHYDGITLAIGTICGSVYVYDVRKMVNPLHDFNSQSGIINKLVYQPSSVVRGRRSKGSEVSLNKQIFKPVGARLENTGSSTSSCDDLFSPIAKGSDAQKLTNIDANENYGEVFGTSMSTIASKEETPDGNIVTCDADFLFSPLKSSDTYQKLEECLLTTSVDTSPSFLATPLKANVATTQPFLMTPSTANVNTTSPFLASPLTTSVATTQPFLATPFTVNLNSISQFLATPLTTSVGTTSQFLATPLTTSVATTQPFLATPLTTSVATTQPFLETPFTANVNTTSPFLTSPLTTSVATTSQFLATPLTSVGITPPFLSSLLTANESTTSPFVAPLLPANEDTTLTRQTNGTLHFENGQVNSQSLKSVEFKCEDSAKESSTVNGFEGEHNSDSELNDIFSKYSISERSKDALNASLTFEESAAEDVKKEKRPLTLAPIKEASKEIKEKGDGDSLKDPLDMKKYIDEMLKNMSYELTTKMHVLHSFNVLAHSKQEVLLSHILSELRKEKVDKCVGTDEPIFNNYF